MLIQVTLLSKAVLTNFTFEYWLISFMNNCNILIQVTLSRKSVVTNFIAEWLFSFMNRCNMLFQVSVLRTNYCNIRANWGLCIAQTTDYRRPMKPFFIQIPNFWA